MLNFDVSETLEPDSSAQLTTSNIRRCSYQGIPASRIQSNPEWIENRSVMSESAVTAGATVCYGPSSMDFAGCEGFELHRRPISILLFFTCFPTIRTIKRRSEINRSAPENFPPRAIWPPTSLSDLNRPRPSKVRSAPRSNSPHLHPASGHGSFLTHLSTPGSTPPIRLLLVSTKLRQETKIALETTHEP